MKDVLKRRLDTCVLSLKRSTSAARSSFNSLVGETLRVKTLISSVSKCSLDLMPCTLHTAAVTAKTR